ncbi:GNAT family N-acetyltransferase [Corynebacterium sp. YSMAA1_1_F7]|uniref:GNAT family N-acetyltransferase n=1 Tax=Corynebacterium sp. YSMAA1_1_F7 TaxID=3383590 RepID=UPI0038D1A0F2
MNTTPPSRNDHRPAPQPQSNPGGSAHSRAGNSTHSRAGSSTHSRAGSSTHSPAGNELDLLELRLFKVRHTDRRPVFESNPHYQFDEYWSDPDGIANNVAVYSALEGSEEVARVCLEPRGKELEIGLIDVCEPQRGRGLARWVVRQLEAMYPHKQLVALPEDEFQYFWEKLGWSYQRDDKADLGKFKMMGPTPSKLQP